AFRLAMTLTPKINESCVTHNMLRLTDTLYRWTGDAIYADFFERGYFNHVLAMQNRSELGGYLYDHPLGSCSRKVFGHSHDAFWCCYGSSIEAFSRLAAGIFYQADDALIVNLPVAAEVRWRGVRVTQSAAYPFDGSASLSIACDTPTVFTLKIRIPSWCQANASATLNGRSVTAGEGRYLSIARTWESGDVVALQFPLTLGVETMPDDPTLISFLAGPHVLAALSEEAIEIPAASAEEAIAHVRIDANSTTGDMSLAAGKPVELIPLSEVGEETFGVYHRVRPE
ncbi:MAG: beta-L-arabinofuranosidase domain-containing protein, partial [Tepidisphaeraceae bacterium]